VSALAPSFIAGGAAIIMLLGLIHLVYTFHGPKLMPRDRELQARMQEVSPVITRETTMWRAWVGFNATRSRFLLSLGLLLLGGYAFVGKRYWFSVPFRGILLATAFYVVALIINWA
jgi:hypothetical protein